MNQTSTINQNVLAQIVKIESLLSDAKGMNQRGSIMLANKTQTIITTLELVLSGTGLLDSYIKSELDSLYTQAHNIINGVYTSC